MEGKITVTLELTPRQKLLLEQLIRLDMIFIDPYADITNLEKLEVLNILHKEISEIICYKCEPGYFNNAVKHHIAKLKESGEPDDEKAKAIEMLSQLLK